MVQPPSFHNRIAAVMEHVSFYSFQGQARLAADAGVSRSAVSRLLAGKAAPSFAVTVAVTAALEKRLGRRLDPRDLVSFDGTYLIPSACDLCGCRGCLPSAAYDAEDLLKPEFRHLVRGGSLSRQYCASGGPQTGGPMD
jgi:transcriptional regulator with XRE-family HTH domain